MGPIMERSLIREAESLWSIDTGICFDSKDVFRELRSMRVSITIPTAQSVFFVRIQHRTDRPARPQAKFLDQSQGFPGNDGAAAVVMCTLAHVPGIKVPADKYDLVGCLRTLDFRHYVCGLGIGQKLCFHFES